MKTRWQAIVQGAVAGMVTILFIVWVVLGTATVNRQNKEILSGVQAQLTELQSGISGVIQTNTEGDRVIVCILNVDPTLRSEAVTQACVTAAADGRTELTPDELKAATHGSQKG